MEKKHARAHRNDFLRRPGLIPNKGNQTIIINLSRLPGHRNNKIIEFRRSVEIVVRVESNIIITSY